MALPVASTPSQTSMKGDAGRPPAKIPPDWLHEPQFAQRSELYEARKVEMKQLALALDKTRPAPYFDLKFARTEALFRDAYRTSGVQDVLNKAATLDPTVFHARAIASGSPTRTAMLDKRTMDKRLESLKFEPLEIMRLRDIPNPGAPELENWWTKANGYREDPSRRIDRSVRLQLSPQRRVVGPVDPAKERSPASVDERRRGKEARRLLAEKITKISHAAASDYHGSDRVDASVVIRAGDLYAQDRRHSISGEGDRSDSALLAAVSPIRPNQRGSPKRAHRHVENLFQESTNQRVLLDQLKVCSAISPSASPHSPTSCTGGNGGTGPDSRPSSSFALLPSPVDKAHSIKDFNGSVRCGGFS